METVYDHSITQSERESLSIASISKEQYLDSLTEENRLWDLAYLFWIREENDKADEYGDLIADEWLTFKIGIAGFKG